jgi:Txe/YoeB family toxin of Txe-Axe toxin-antitoxin module
MVQKLWGFKDFSQTLGMLSATANAAKSAQNCQNLLKSAQRQNFEILPKIEILLFSKNKFFYV